MSKDEMIKDKKHYMDMCFWVLMPWKFNGCYALFVIDHVGQTLFYRVNISYFVLQAMVMWGNDRRMEFDRNAKILRMNFVIDLLSYEDNSCRYAISANIQQRLINIAKKD
ncbi:hypothetical protein Zm00014a_005952 [Zea mays]|uniref:Uncharacterized protein n=1 Tax=Zea mays TaxID=4577 RepID=A0A317Y6J8_MAIZE|nr:hypothetical protein Zm00014a_005952 [Zea mays]